MAWKTYLLVAALAAVSGPFGGTAPAAARDAAVALNPQPLPPGRSGIIIVIRGRRVALNPQPLPPGRQIVIGSRSRGIG